MLRRITFTILAVIMLFCACSQLFSCAKKEQQPLSAAPVVLTVEPSSAAIIGSVEANGFEVTVPEGTFASRTEIIASSPTKDELASRAMNGGSFICPIQINMHTWLSKDATVRIKLPSGPVANNKLDNYFGGYHNGSEWVLIYPDIAELAQGYLVFDTPYLSLLSAIEVTDEAAKNKFAHDSAVWEVAQGAADERLCAILSRYYDYTLSSLGFTDAALRKDLLTCITNSIDCSAMSAAAKSGDMNGFSAFAVSPIGDAILHKVTNGSSESLSPAVCAVTDAVTLLASGGNASEAYNSVFEAALEFFPVAEAAISITSTYVLGAQLWQIFSMEYAYGEYAKLSGVPSENDYDALFLSYAANGLELLKRNRHEDYAVANGITVSEVESDSVLITKLDSVVESEVKRNFALRRSSQEAIAAKEAETIRLFDGYKQSGLLTRQSYGFAYSVNMADRLRVIAATRNTVLAALGSEAYSALGENTELKLNDMLAQWIDKSSTHAAFYDKMLEQGYFKRPEASPFRYVWRFVGVIDHPAENKAPNPPYDYYGYEYTYAKGSFTATTAIDDRKLTTNVSVTLPPQSDLQPGETVTVTIAVSHSTVGNLWSRGAYGCARIGRSYFYNKAGAYGLQTKATMLSDSASDEFSANMPGFAYEGESVSIFLWSEEQGTEFVYVWTRVG